MSDSSIQQLIKKIDAISKRERLIVVAAIVILSLLGWWQYVATPSLVGYNAQKTKRRNAEQSVKLINIQLGGFTEKAISAKVKRINENYEKTTKCPQ